ncbi:hypothetical protein E4U22_004290, partial [Claviceps purpurea]
MVRPYKLVQLHIRRDFLREQRTVFDKHKLCKVSSFDFKAIHYASNIDDSRCAAGKTL